MSATVWCDVVLVPNNEVRPGNAYTEYSPLATVWYGVTWVREGGLGEKDEMGAENSFCFPPYLFFVYHSSVNKKKL